MQGITEDLKKNVRSVLISNPKGVKIDQLHRDYRSLLGHPVDFRRCGFRSMVEFLEAMPDVAQLEFQQRDNNYRVFAVTDPDLYLPSALKKGIRHLPDQTQDETTAFYQRQVWASDLQSNMRGQYALGITKTPGLTREEISDEFNQVGEVTEVSFTERNVFVRYNNKEEALDALERFHTRYNLWIPTERNNPRQVVKKKDAFMKKKKPTSTNDDIVELYVGNLPRNINQEDILSMVDDGIVYQIRDMKKEDKRYMFLAVKHNSVDRVISQLHQKHIGGQRIWAQLSYNYRDSESKEASTEEGTSQVEDTSQVIKGHVGVLQDLDYERSSSSDSLNSCGFDTPMQTMEMPPLEAALPRLEPAMPPLERAMPPLERAMPPLERAMPPLERAMPPLERAMPPLEMAMPPLEPALPPLELAMPGLEPAGSGTYSAGPFAVVRPFGHVSHQQGILGERPSLNPGHVHPRPQGPRQAGMNPGLRPTYNPRQAGPRRDDRNQSQSNHLAMQPQPHHNHQPHSQPTHPAAPRQTNPRHAAPNPRAAHHSFHSPHMAQQEPPHHTSHAPHMGQQGPPTHHDSSPRMANPRSPLLPDPSPRTAHQPIANLPAQTASYSDNQIQGPFKTDPADGELPIVSWEKEQEIRGEIRPTFHALPPLVLVNIAFFPKFASWIHLRAFFSELKPVKVIVIEQDQDQKRTHAAMLLRSEEFAEEALQYNGSLFMGNKIAVYRNPDHQRKGKTPKRQLTSPDIDQPGSLTVKIRNTEDDSCQRKVVKKTGKPDFDITKRGNRQQVSSSITTNDSSPELWAEKAMCQELYRAVCCCRPDTQLWSPSDLRSDTVIVVVTSVVSDTHIWGQVVDTATDNELTWLMNATPDMQDSANHMSYLPGSKTCLAPYEGEWFRGCVIEVKRGTASVFALDYGNTVKVPIMELRDLPEDYWGVTAQAWPIRVVSPVDDIHALDQMKIRAKVLNKDDEDPVLAINIIEISGA